MLTLENEMLMFSDAIRSDHPSVTGWQLNLAACPGVNAHARLGIYRNNTYASLTAVLLAVFPVTARMVDERYFRYASHEFIRSNPPIEPRLSQFGGSFPGFLSGFGHLKEMPFIAETARLEWAIAGALDERGIEPMPITQFAALPDAGERSLILQPSLRLIASRWPVYSIWTEHQRVEDPQLGFLRRGNAERMAIIRRGTAIQLIHLDAVQFKFVRLLARGEPLGQAARRAMCADPLFDLATALAQLFSEGMAVGMKPNMKN